MKTITRAVERAAWIFLVLLIPLGASAHTLTAPLAVSSREDGSFHYTCVFEVGPGAFLVGSFGWSGIENVLGGEIADCFCDPEFCLLDEGETLVFEVSGNLVDLELRGTVRSYVSPCSGEAFHAETLVTTPTDSWNEEQGRDLSTPLRVAPNPFILQTTFSYALPEPGRVQLRIYDVAGRLVATPIDENQSAGRHSLTWDARGAAGSSLPPGVYVARMITNGVTRTRRLVISH